MSSNCPPQLQLSLQTSTTSFKRSFDQFGFDLESPGGATDAGGSGANNGNDRNKRARSASSFSEGSDSMDSSHLSTIASGSSESSPSRHEDANDPTTSSIAVLGASLSTHSALEPPRLPTPDIQDIEMPDYPVDNSESFADSLAPQVPDPEDRYRLPMDRYNPFRNESGLRRPQSSSSLVSRSPTAPPVLPPLYISEDQTRLSTSPMSFLHPSPQLHSTSDTGSFFNDESPSSIRTPSSTTNRDNSLHEEQVHHDPLFQNEFQPTRDPLAFSVPSNRLQSVPNNTNNSRSERRAVPPSLSTSNPTHFRDHLNSALDLLRTSSPLVPGFEDVGREAGLSHAHVINRISRALPNPPTLPPIVTDTDNNNSPPDVFTPDAPSATSFTSSTTNFDLSTSASSSLDLGDHPLPSPGLHDLHSWMDASSHSWHTSQIPASSVTTDSRQDFSNVTDHQGTFATSSTGQSRADRGHTSSVLQQLTSSSPTVLTSPPLRHRFMRMSDLEGNHREWPSTMSMSTLTSTSASQSIPDSQSNPDPASIGLPPLPFNRRSADEVTVRSLDQGFDSRLSSSARSALGGSASHLHRFRVHESQLADEADTGDRGLTSQLNLVATNRRITRESLAEYVRRTVDVPDAGDNDSAGPPPTPQAATRYPDPDSLMIQMINNSAFAGSRTGFNNNNHGRDLHLRQRLRGYGTQMTRPGASNSLVNESAVEARRLADRLEVLERMNEASREHRRDSGSSISGALGDSLDSHLRSLEADLRENGMSSVGWDPARPNRRSFGPTNDSEDSRRPWNHFSGRQPPIVNRRSNYLPSLPQHNILPLPGLSSNDDMDMVVGESIGFRPIDFTSGSASSNNNTRNNPILPSSLYDNPMSSRTAGRRSDYSWLNTSHPAPADQNSMDAGISPELPSPAPETDIFNNSRYSTIPNMVNTIGGTSSSTGGGQRRHSASSDSSHSDSVHETRSNQPYLSDPPSLPPPDLGGVFDAERHASSIAISDENPETIFVHPPRRPLRDTSGISQSNLPFTDRPPSSIPIQDDSNSATANSNIRISYGDNRRRQASATSELEALIQRQRRSELEARRISAIAEEFRGMVGSSSNNPAAYSVNPQAQSVSDLNRSLGRNYCNTTNVEPTERRNHTRTVPSTPSEPPFARYQSLDPSSFTPGPFRNTVQQLFNERRHIQRRQDPSPSVPPTIPPLSFEDNDLSNSLQQRILLHQLRRPTETAQATTSTSNRDTIDDRVRRERAIAEEGLRREQQQAMNLRRLSDRLAAARGMNENNRRRETSDIHRYLTQQARMEASRLEDPETPSSRVLSNAIDVLRHDDVNTARTQQLIERFHREREGLRTRAVGTEPESTPVAMTASAASPRRPDGRRFLRESIMRREAGLGDEDRRSVYSSALAQQIQEEQRDSEELGLSQSMRGRRGRFPRTPGEVMYSLGRHARRAGTFGDYMRDEDFDESYEGLLSLSAALGEVKPKSTPASILSELETAQYKDWATSESDQRCPICLDDYQPTDQVLKLNNCSHWLHKDCLHQWLQGARTCPVCRKSVYLSTPQASSSTRRLHPRHPHMHYPIFGGANPSWRRDHPPGPPPPPGVDPI